MIKKIITIFCGMIIVLGLTTVAYAEQSGSSPESGATSHVKTIYDAFVALSYGSDAAGSWGDWGAEWNRLRSAAEFTPSGDATVTDVKNTVTYNSNSRAGAVGTYPNPTNCVTQGYADNHASATPANNCSLTWEIANPSVTGDDMKDPRTGLIWSQPLKNEGGNVTFAINGYTTFTWDVATPFTVTAANATVGAVYSNNGQQFTVLATIAAATTLYTSATGEATATGTLTKVSGTGDATITFSSVRQNNLQVGSKTATQLCTERGNGWRLPTEVEFMQAYIDGAYYNLIAAATTNHTKTEAAATTVFQQTISNGSISAYFKWAEAYIRCVR